MCGIAGLIDRALTGDRAGLERRAEAMADAIAYRGPDGAGVWADAEQGVALAHRRLAIVDVTPTGAQPMQSADERWVISYNGETYNAAAIAEALKGVSFRGTSDTEIMLESIARRGLERTLGEMNGMFAIALWDSATRTLHLIRDRLGIKPLFFAASKTGVWFASELKALAAGGAGLEVDPQSVGSFLRYGYVPAPHSIFRDVQKVMPGEAVAIDAQGIVTRRRYWSIDDVAADGAVDPFKGSESEAAAELDALLSDAIAGQMMSDVPLGAFLSGGIDSSTVAALMVKARRGPVRTFSIGFPEFGYDESAQARAVARHLGTEHHELTVTAADALGVVPQLAEMYDEPFADSSQIPTHLLSKFARSRVTVALSGDGGDELFSGYNRYRLDRGALGALARLPAPLRRALASTMSAMPAGFIDAVARVVPPALRPPQAADKVKKLAAVLPLDDEARYLRLVSQCPDPGALTRGIGEHAAEFSAAGGARSFAEQMQLFDTATYLPDDILQKVDRASMAVSLEVRPPLLDHRVVAFAWRLPRQLRMRGRESKWLLRRVLQRYVPPALTDRPKMGFGIPLAAWLRGPLRDWAEDMLDPARLGGGLFDAAAMRGLWREHLSGEANWAYALWTILMYEAWRRRWTGRAAETRASRFARAGSV